MTWVQKAYLGLAITTRANFLSLCSHQLQDLQGLQGKEGWPLFLVEEPEAQGKLACPRSHT